MPPRPVTALLAAALSLPFAACVPAAPPGAQPAPPPDAAACGAAGLQGLVGQPDSVLARMRFAQPVRVIRPGMAVTMDHSPFRLNILIDRAGQIQQVSCG